jgi:hypothetical protein
LVSQALCHPKVWSSAGSCSSLCRSPRASVRYLKAWYWPSLRDVDGQTLRLEFVDVSYQQTHPPTTTFDHSKPSHICSARLREETTERLRGDRHSGGTAGRPCVDVTSVSRLPLDKSFTSATAGQRVRWLPMRIAVWPRPLSWLRLFGRSHSTCSNIRNGMIVSMHSHIHMPAWACVLPARSHLIVVSRAQRRVAAAGLGLRKAHCWLWLQPALSFLPFGSV